MTDGIRTTVEDWTGYAPPSCPWHALHDPFVGRVVKLVDAFETGNLHVVAPRISHRAIEGVQFYRRADSAIYSQQLKGDAEERKRRG